MTTEESPKIEEIHAQVHIVDAPKIDATEGSEVVGFTDKYITCALPIETKYPEMSNLVKNCRPTIIRPFVEKRVEQEDIMLLGHHQIKLK